MNTLLAVMAVIGILVTLFVLTAVIAGAIHDFKKYRQRRKGKKITIGNFLIEISGQFEDAHVSNAMYIVGKKIKSGEVLKMREINEEVKYLNNLKCKQ